MCFGGAPKAPAAPPPPEYLHNAYLDGASIAGMGSTTGRNNLRIDLNAPTASGVNATAPAPSDLSKMLPSPGVVVPTIGGVLAGTLPGTSSTSMKRP